ncbi:electron transfer flavoprotein beta subunit lysine methyltransferase [Ambystoma mexicanum]|uniref:electron transfer flavoprotein beta subunit lysine methyltransferase n=1 Tax=Ambystoma mexicanum TaxID=8296 RepID=UPI0037E9A29B
MCRLGFFVRSSVRAWGVFTQVVCYSTGNWVRKFIEENTEICREHLTPEIRLRLLTPRCPFWHGRPDSWPFADPYWAIYWPGGQALSRYLLDNPHVAEMGSVLDLGSGCGATAIAAGMSGASRILANDIDPVAGTAIAMNCELNNMVPFPVLTKNITDTEPEKWSLIVLGDMFYDEELADCLQEWLRQCIHRHGTKVLIGDPGRPQFVGHGIQKQLCRMAEYPLPESTKQENYGLTSCSVWSYEP